MANKKVWVSALSKDEQRIGQLSGALKRYGFDSHGHIWVDENDKLAWRAAYDEMQKLGCTYWLILADAASLEKQSIRYGLSLMSYCLRRDHQDVSPIIIFGNESVLRPHLPQALSTAPFIDDAASGWEAKIVTNTLRLPAPKPLPYRIDVYGDERIGQWFEIGPNADTDADADTDTNTWAGVMFGVTGAGADITFQAVGPAGKLPDKSVLQYAREGLKLESDGGHYLAWSVRNPITPQESYFARMRGFPEKLLIMPDEGNAEADSVEAYVIELS